MKKFFVIPIMFIYLLAVSGIMVTVHYCGQEMESLSFFSKSDKCDETECNDEPGKSDGCCQDKTVAAKVTNEQDAVNAFKLKLQPIEIVAVLTTKIYSDQNDVRLSAIEAPSYRANAPPGLWQSIPLFKLHSSFTYYG
jgi:hypothetical protein